MRDISGGNPCRRRNTEPGTDSRHPFRGITLRSALPGHPLQGVVPEHEVVHESDANMA